MDRQLKELSFLKHTLEQNGMLNEDCVGAICSIEKQLQLFQKLEESLYNPNLYLVYMHTTPDGKKYIGITKSTPGTRWNEGAGYESQRKFYKAIQAYGWMNIEHRILSAGLTESEAKTLESKLILQYQTNDPQFGYNTNLSVAQVKTQGSDTKKDTDNKPKTDFREISVQLIKKYSLKTITGQIYYLCDGEYVREAHQPVLSKELLMVYGVPPKKHREIFQMIEILSVANKEDVFPTTKEPKSKENPLRQFIETFLLRLSEDGYYSIGQLNNDYLSWVQDNSLSPLDNEQLVNAITSELRHSHPEVEKAEMNGTKGWKMLPVYVTKSGEMKLTARGAIIIRAWLDDTSEPSVCISMILDQALQYSGKCSKKTRNEIGNILRNSGWEADKLTRFIKYGVQKSFVRC